MRTSGPYEVLQKDDLEFKRVFDGMAVVFEFTAPSAALVSSFTSAVSVRASP